MAHSLREQRAQRTVDQTGSQDRLFGGTAFAAIPGARNAADGIQLFFKIHAQREKVDARARRFGDGGVDQNAGIAVTDEGGTAGLFCVLAEFQRKRATAQLHGIALEHDLPP